jgi:CHAT domain
MPKRQATDALKIYYLIVLATDDPHHVTPFQGFSESWAPNLWALKILSTVPADVLEPTSPLDGLTALRIGGVRSIAWSPINLGALESHSAFELGVFVVLFTGETECAKRVAAWCKRQAEPALHVSPHEVEGAIQPDALNLETLRVYCKKAMSHGVKRFRQDQLDACEGKLDKWETPVAIPSGLTLKSHNITIPNYMSLERAGRSIADGESFIANTEQEYTDTLLESARPIGAIRDEIGVRGFHFRTLMRPELILAEPALYRLNYQRLKPEGPFKEKVVAQTLRWLQTQKGLCSQHPSEFVKELLESKAAQILLSMRGSEAFTFTAGVGLRAAETCSAVVRLSPGVNHVFSSLAIYAKNIRSTKLEARLKTRKLFDAIQDGLTSAVGADRINYIKERGGPIKLVTDAPVEWLPIDDLPLAMRYDCSRINATPGNMLMAMLCDHHTLIFHPEQMQKVLVINAFTDDDPLKNVLTSALGAIKESWQGKVEVIFKATKTKDEFAAALNDYDGCIMIFDGHGRNNAEEPIGKLAIGKEEIDVWELRGRVRVPPIVLLSACDTHGIDAASQATVGNGFLFLGARTVLATLLPLGGGPAALFMARLVYRLADFIPAVIESRVRVLNWTEIISGMLRMFLATELLDQLIGPPDGIDTPRGKLQHDANGFINTREDDRWYEKLLDRIAEHKQCDVAQVQSKARGIVARSEAIRYIQLGNPESILIDDGVPKGPIFAEKELAKMIDEVMAQEAAKR